MTITEVSQDQEQMAGQVPPPMQIIQLMLGKHVAYSLSAVARLGVADYVTSEPVTVEEIADQAGAHAPSLYRVMRLLACFGVFAEHPGKMFSATPASDCLRSDSPASLRPVATMWCDKWNNDGLSALPDTLRTGIDGITTTYGKNVFELLKEQPEESARFQSGMTSFAFQAGHAVSDVYDFSSFSRIADVGGGNGTLLSVILQRNPHLKGVLYDLPEVTAAPDAKRELSPVADRVTIESGSFFERVPAGCDAYLLKHIIHDWSDEHGQTILNLIREQLPKNGCVLLCELVVPDSPGLHPAKLLDIEMLAQCVGGKERTEREFDMLAASAGLRVARIVQTQSPFCVVELRHA